MLEQFLKLRRLVFFFVLILTSSGAITAYAATRNELHQVLDHMLEIQERNRKSGFLVDVIVHSLLDSLGSKDLVQKAAKKGVKRDRAPFSQEDYRTALDYERRLSRDLGPSTGRLFSIIIESLENSIRKTSETNSCKRKVDAPLGRPQLSLISSIRDIDRFQSRPRPLPAKKRVQTKFTPKGQALGRQLDDQSFNLASEADRVHGNKRRPSYEVKASGKQKQKPKFLRYFVVGDGDCALHAMGIKREQFIERLVSELTDKNNPEIRKLIQLEIIINNKTREYNQNSRQDLVNYVSDEMSSSDHYLDEPSITAAAQLFKRNVRIWQTSPNSRTSLQKAHIGDLKYNSNDDAFINLFHSGIHYDLLVEENNWEGRLDASLREMGWTRMHQQHQREEGSDLEFLSQLD